MSLVTGSLKVEQGPEHVRYSKGYLWQPCEWEPPLHLSGKYSPDPILTNAGGKRWEPESTKNRFNAQGNTRSAMISSKCEQEIQHK